jgi:hypothetical protein
MAKVMTLRKHGISEGFGLLGRYCLSALKGVALITGGIGGLAIIGIILMLAVFPIFIIGSMLFKFLGF